jgi:hypothetical protein
MKILSNPFSTPDVIGEPMTSGNIPYINVFDVCPSPGATGGIALTNNLPSPSPR